MNKHIPIMICWGIAAVFSIATVVVRCQDEPKEKVPDGFARTEQLYREEEKKPFDQSIREIGEMIDRRNKEHRESMQKVGALLYRAIERTGTNPLIVPKDYPKGGVVIMNELPGDRIELEIQVWETVEEFPDK